jgi:hypothetical protein
MTALFTQNNQGSVVDMMTRFLPGAYSPESFGRIGPPYNPHTNLQ